MNRCLAFILMLSAGCVTAPERAYLDDVLSEDEYLMIRHELNLPFPATPDQVEHWREIARRRLAETRARSERLYRERDEARARYLAETQLTPEQIESLKAGKMYEAIPVRAFDLFVADALGAVPGWKRPRVSMRNATQFGNTEMWIWEEEEFPHGRKYFHFRNGQLDGVTELTGR